MGLAWAHPQSVEKARDGHRQLPHLIEIATTDAATCPHPQGMNTCENECRHDANNYVVPVDLLRRDCTDTACNTATPPKRSNWFLEFLCYLLLFQIVHVWQDPLMHCPFDWRSRRAALTARVVDVLRQRLGEPSILPWKIWQ